MKQKNPIMVSSRGVTALHYAAFFVFSMAMMSISAYAGATVNWNSGNLSNLDGAGTRTTIMNLIMYVGWAFALVKAIQGIRELDRGEEGKTKLVQAALFAAVPTVANFIW